MLLYIYGEVGMFHGTLEQMFWERDRAHHQHYTSRITWNKYGTNCEKVEQIV